MNFRHICAIALLAAALSGCAYTNSVDGASRHRGFVSPIGQDTYLISRQGSSGFVMPTTLRNEALYEANNYCRGMGRQLQVVNVNTIPQIPLGAPGGPRFPAAEVQFMCLSSGDPDAVRTVLRQRPDIVTEHTINQNINIRQH